MKKYHYSTRHQHTHSLKAKQELTDHSPSYIEDFTENNDKEDKKQ